MPSREVDSAVIAVVEGWHAHSAPILPLPARTFPSRLRPRSGARAGLAVSIRAPMSKASGRERMRAMCLRTAAFSP